MLEQVAIAMTSTKTAETRTIPQWLATEKLKAFPQEGEGEEGEVTRVPSVISLGDGVLDEMLYGGIRIGSITEIAGES